jgi:tetratricopeptide (TPR) repeat protein
VFIAVGVPIAAAARLAGLDPEMVRLAAWVVAISLWFLAVYLVVVALTPVMLAAHRRWGLAVPAALTVVAAGFDALRLTAGVGYLGVANFLVVWLILPQLGFAWRDGTLTRTPARPWLLFLGGSIALVALTTVGPYPISMVGVPGTEVQNTSPPTVALLALAVAHTGLVLLLAGPLRRWLLAVDRDQIDAARFERLVGQARPILASAPGEAAALLHTALSLWRGEPLADFTFEPFAQSEITRLTELRLTALEDRIGAELALGRHAALCGELAQLVAEHPLRERLSGQLLVALYRCGRQAEALGAYADLRETLVEQLGIDPSPALRQLQAAILRQDRELDWPGAAIGPAPPPVPVPLATVEDLPVERSMEAILGSARSAARLCRWQEAFDLFAAADERGDLGGEDLDALAEAAFWLGRPDVSHVARQRAHARLLADGRPRRAAMAAIVLSLNFGARRRFSVAGGWFQRAQRLLAEEPEGPEHGFLAWAGSMSALATGDHDGALQAARRAFDLGRRFGIPDLQALGLVLQGYILVRDGKVDEGLLLMDEGMTWALDGQLAPTSSAVIFCRTIDTCYALGDYRRASEWMEAIADCFARSGIDAFPGDCEAHSVGILVGRGAWSEGERRARRACAAMEPMDLTHVGLALAEIGEIQWRRGDLAGADEAFTMTSAERGDLVRQRAHAELSSGEPHALQNRAPAGLSCRQTWHVGIEEAYRSRSAWRRGSCYPRPSRGSRLAS